VLRSDPDHDHNREETSREKQRTQTRGAPRARINPDAARRIGDEHDDAREHGVRLKGDEADAPEHEDEECREPAPRLPLVEEGQEDHDDTGEDRKAGEVGIERPRDDIAPGERREGKAAERPQANRQAISRKDPGQKGAGRKGVDEGKEHGVCHVLGDGRRISHGISRECRDHVPGRRIELDIRERSDGELRGGRRLNRREPPCLQERLDATEMGGVVELLGKGIGGPKRPHEEQGRGGNAHEGEEHDEAQLDLRTESLARPAVSERERQADDSHEKNGTDHLRPAHGHPGQSIGHPQQHVLRDRDRGSQRDGGAVREPGSPQLRNRGNIETDDTEQHAEDELQPHVRARYRWNSVLASTSAMGATRVAVTRSGSSRQAEPKHPAK